MNAKNITLYLSFVLEWRLNVSAQSQNGHWDPHGSSIPQEKLSSRLSTSSQESISVVFFSTICQSPFDALLGRAPSDLNRTAEPSHECMLRCSWMSAWEGFQRLRPWGFPPGGLPPGGLSPRGGRGSRPLAAWHDHVVSVTWCVHHGDTDHMIMSCC